MVSSNSGVEGGSGYSFQRCCVVFLLFESYEEINIENYFICLEHHEDFLFAFLDENRHLKKIDTYQAKKSRDDWTTDSDLCKIIGKMTKVGKELVNDPHDKSNDYQHTLNFLTNRNVLLTSKKEEGVKQDRVKVQVSNRRKKYSDLTDKIKKNIEPRICKSILESTQLENVHFQYIDFAQSYKNWQRELKGLSMEHFGQEVNDHEAVISSLMRLLEDAEQTYNDDNKVLLSDLTKRVSKDKINETFNMFTESKKSFDFWRKYSEEISTQLELKLPIRRRANELLENCFDYFKDIQQVEYRKIYKFVETRTDIDERHISEADCIVDLYHSYQKEFQPRLESYMVSFAVIAAYVETRGMYV
ncbi:dsDNA nuclease domain-containing protein [uncultured Shewanella sp.]|uniref:dsDNA nuclease domain-containing protein n=1 Tax=uncultured Shewanella sp. TaxID=173975 RepID=UPI00262AE241|nr:dsDNA nuclease domain-containing protein [uncultured Shewanella sp.]